MNIRGFVKFSLVDYPGRISCVVFVGCCNFRCPYCHNPHLVIAPESQPQLLQSTIMDFLAERRGLLDAMVVSGGEPTMRPKLPEFLAEARRFGIEIKLDTNGTNPHIIEQLHNQGLIDCIGIDYKAPRHKYALVAGRDNALMTDNVYKTLGYAVAKGIRLDVRTTVHRLLLDEDDLRIMRKDLDDMGIDEWTLQQFNPVDVIDEKLRSTETYTNAELSGIARRLGGRTRTRGMVELMVQPAVNQ